VIVRRVDTPSFRGTLAAVSIQACAPGAFRGFGVWDVTDPTRPRRLGLYATDQRTGGSHEIWLQPVGGKAYVYTAVILSEVRTSPDGVTPGRPDFRIVDVSDPARPTEVGVWGAWSELGLRPSTTDANGVPRSNFVHSVTGDGTRAYLSYWDLGTVILDVSNPAQPRYLGRTSYAPNEQGNAHSAWAVRRSGLLIQTDEDFDPGPSGALEQSWGYVRIFSISNPAEPRQLSTFKLPSTTTYPSPPGYWSVHDPKISGSLAYFSWYAEGVVVVDVSRPATPVQVAQFVPEPAADPRGYFGPPDVKFAHVWGVFVDGSRVLVSDINSGLWVLERT
jgi:hypothetical protein